MNKKEINNIEFNDFDSDSAQIFNSCLFSMKKMLGRLFSQIKISKIEIYREEQKIVITYRIKS